VGKILCGYCAVDDHESCLTDNVRLPQREGGDQPQHFLVQRCGCPCGPLSVSLVKFGLASQALAEMACVGLYTVGDLLEYYLPDLMKLTGFGAGSMFKVLTGLRDLDVKHPGEEAL